MNRKKNYKNSLTWARSYSKFTSAARASASATNPTEKEDTMPTNQKHKPLHSVDLSHLPVLDGRPIATAKQLSQLSGRTLSQVYATVHLGATKKIEGTPFLDAGSYFDYMRVRKVGRPSSPKPESTATDTTEPQ